MKKNRRRNSVVTILILLLLSITVGYATLSTTLNITGTSTIKNANWDVHFENLTVKDGSVTAATPATPDAAKTTITYTVNLEKPGDFYEFTVDVKNAGSVDAKLSELPILNGVNDSQDVYTNYTITHTDGTAITANEKLLSGASKNFKIRIEFDKNITAEQLPSSAQTLNLTLKMNYVQA